MNPIEESQAQVMTAVNGPCHGRPGKYYILGTGTGIQLNFISNIDSGKSVFDTGTSDLDFNVMTGLISANDVSATPLEQGRGSVGDTFIFDDVLGTTWHVRQVAASAEFAGSYYDIVLADYTGPVTGV